jgi:hypothetical protein
VVEFALSEQKDTGDRQYRQVVDEDTSKGFVTGCPECDEITENRAAPRVQNQVMGHG